jgi:hypothetical protein
MAKQRQPDQHFVTLHRLEDIPDFQSEEEEYAFWSTHELGEEILNAAQPFDREVLPPTRKLTTVR